jgi:drug/metabolite transporter (DMT)-like permease
LCLVSSVILGLLYISGQVTSGIADTPLLTVIAQFIVQAVLVGIVAGFTYGFAINLIGAELSAAIGSLTPVLVSLFAIPLLNESLSMASGLGLALVCSGVVLASGLSLRSIFSR